MIPCRVGVDVEQNDTELDELHRTQDGFTGTAPVRRQNAVAVLIELHA